MTVNSSINTRLLINGPFPDESISSILRRAGSMYGMTPSGVLESLCVRAGVATAFNDADDLDNPVPAVLGVIADSLGLSASALLPCVIKDGVQWVSHNSRCAYCPLCFLDDWRSGKSPYFRRKWALVWKTMCDDHWEPLIEWPHNCDFPQSWQYFVSPATPFPVSGLQPFSRILIKAKGRHIEGDKWIGYRLLQHLVLWESWLMHAQAKEQTSGLLVPTEAKDGELRSVAKLATIFGLNRSRTVERLPAPAGTLEADLDGWAPRRGPLMNPLGDPLWEHPWDAYRSLGDPAARRAASCMAAITLRRKWPVSEATGFRLGLKSGTPAWWKYINRYLVSTGWSNEALLDLQEVMAARGIRERFPVQQAELPPAVDGQVLGEYVHVCKSPDPNWRKRPRRRAPKPEVIPPAAPGWR